ncbi:hypothetical protein [Ectothiorhodospira lacustris]|uniref:hypothetical protein n=1 Tax=Ectothiorhodospira lacustris TaxID=2899127 RepID=UPI001EE8756D|nr:hypothetical protein [Ectothiorhodospira lacustris]MCG5500073.1 hypothetical protein [Ectothiorhodospira lacustris]MCG5509427.1 hypothetical protein [Ectothiorhodospira lacustris]MCG5521481.1 hypothetical protein [Ectothiorhodospira lacustris]
MKVEVTVELDIALSKVSLGDMRRLAEQLFADHQIEAIRQVRIVDVTLKRESGSGDSQL